MLLWAGSYRGLGNHPFYGLSSTVILVGTVLGSYFLARGQALNYAARQMTFVLDDDTIARKRRGYPEIKIFFTEIACLKDKPNWLIVESTEPRKIIVVPKMVGNYDVIITELSKYCAISYSQKQSFNLILPLTMAAVSWTAVFWFHELQEVVPAGVIALLLLIYLSHRIWRLNFVAMLADYLYFLFAVLG